MAVLSLLIAAAPMADDDCGSSADAAPALQVFRTIDLTRYAPGFITLGDLDSDGTVDLLLSHLGDQSTHVGLVACNLAGETVWEAGAPRAAARDGRRSGEPNCRGYCLVYDLDGDGRSEVIVELTRKGESRLCILDGATGKETNSIPWPLGKKDARSRPAPTLLVAHLDGKHRPPSLIVKYEASGTCRGRAVALDADLKERWRLDLRGNAMGHHPTVFDLTGDGRDDVIFGEVAVNHAGEMLYDQQFAAHADMTAPFVDTAGHRRVMVSICQQGPVYCLDGSGKIVWQKTPKEVSHGQAVWVGNFLPERKGLETIVLKDGHYGIFGTYDAGTGKAVGGFEHRSGLKRPGGQRNYPDMPVKVRWPAGERDALWIPGDRALVDGMGNVLAGLGPRDEEIKRELNAGQAKNKMNVQAIAVNLYDDERDDLVLYQPVGGRAMVYIVGAADKARAMKPYRHEAHVYNRKSYF